MPSLTDTVLRTLSPVLIRESIFAIAMYGGSSPFELAPLPGLPAPALSAADVRDVPAVMVADPFMIRAGARWHMFFEVLNRRGLKGQIGLASSDDGRRWRYDRIVLDEPFHLSYPYVFAHGGAHYMIPESSADRSVRLYRAAAFPRRWELAATLLSGADYYDASVFQHQGRWWMFVGTNTAANDTLRLFSAPDLHGPWAEHPASPLISGDPHTARPAGRVVVHNGSPIRFAQDCYPEYGMAVRAFEVLELTPASYRERPLTPEPFLRAGAGRAWNNRGMHQIDAHQLPDGSWIACVDGYKRSFILR